MLINEAPHTNSHIMPALKSVVNDKLNFDFEKDAKKKNLQKRKDRDVDV
jgi:hypothetical protein